MDDFVAGAIARGRENPSWTPLESNPDALNQFAAGIGLEPSFQFSDCFGLDEDLLGFLPQPVVAFVLLFPFDNPAIARAKQELEEKLAKSAQPAVKDVFWMEQSIGERKRKRKKKTTRN
jgi:ubiquitin carboxyl-terminal hydrolase L3